MNMYLLENGDYGNKTLDEYWDQDYRKDSYSVYTPLDCESEEDYNIKLFDISDKKRCLSFDDMSFYSACNGYYRYKFKFYQYEYEVNCYRQGEMIASSFAVPIELSMYYLKTKIIDQYNMQKDGYLEVKRV